MSKEIAKDCECWSPVAVDQGSAEGKRVLRAIQQLSLLSSLPDKLFLVHPAVTESRLSLNKLKEDAASGFFILSFLRPKGCGNGGFYSFCTISNIIVNNGLPSRQPTDTYGRQSWGRPRVPKGWWGRSSDCGLCAVTVNQVFGAFLLLSEATWVVTLNSLLAAQHILFVLLNTSLHRIIISKFSLMSRNFLPCFFPCIHWEPILDSWWGEGKLSSAAWAQPAVKVQVLTLVPVQVRSRLPVLTRHSFLSANITLGKWQNG